MKEFEAKSWEVLTCEKSIKEISINGIPDALLKIMTEFGEEKLVVLEYKNSKIPTVRSTL